MRLFATMSYVLATTETVIRWYRFDPRSNDRPISHELLATLDLNLIPQLPDKEAAKRAAEALGLSTWRYIKL